jgi:hypothetical protein
MMHDQTQNKSIHITLRTINSHFSLLLSVNVNYQERCIQNFGGTNCGEKANWKPGRSWEDKIKMDHYEVGLGGLARIDLAQDRAS